MTPRQDKTPEHRDCKHGSLRRSCEICIAEGERDAVEIKLTECEEALTLVEEVAAKAQEDLEQATSRLAARRLVDRVERNIRSAESGR